MEVMTLAMMELLDKVEKPLTFVVVVPNWPDTPSLVEMTESRYNRKLLTCVSQPVWLLVSHLGVSRMRGIL
jgi:hypothetical protein